MRLDRYSRSGTIWVHYDVAENYSMEDVKEVQSSGTAGSTFPPTSSAVCAMSIYEMIHGAGLPWTRGQARPPTAAVLWCRARRAPAPRKTNGLNKNIKKNSTEAMLAEKTPYST